MTDTNSPDPTPIDDEPASQDPTQPRKDNEQSNVDKAIEENTSVTGIGPDAS
mgnify:CR=1 FL=1